MTLQVRFVQDLSHIVDPVADYLNRDIESLDLFEQQHVIVPTAGVRAWLVPQLARRLGASGERGDGIVSNVHFGYVGALNALLRNGIDDDSDAWSIDHITMAVLRVISHDPMYSALEDKYGGWLRAARAIADRFDRYAARRPQMIRAWERGSMMIPGVNVADTDAAQRFAWQYELWREVRNIIGVPSWPARSEELIAQLREGVTIPGLPRRLMVAGLESISASNLEVLVALGNAIDVEALFVHPSPLLREVWTNLEPRYRNEAGEVPVRDENFVTEDADALVSTWMRGTFELQMLLASQGISAVHEQVEQPQLSDDLLACVQRAVENPMSVVHEQHRTDDRSVTIHRAHNLARQVEVLHDALLHAFTDLPNLQPHEVLVLCADIAAAAPLLKATFDREVVLADGRTVSIPLTIADRSLRDVSAGAELLGSVLSLADSRFDANSVFQIAGSPLVLGNFSLDESDVATWIRLADISRVRWGIDTEHRAHHEFEVPAITAHTWLNSIERALLGALVPDAPPALELGGVVPIAHVDVADVAPLAGLAGILAPLATLENSARTSRPVGEWCDLVEHTLLELCGESCTEIDDALDVITQFRRGVTLEHSNVTVQFDDPVPYVEFAELIGRLLTTSPGRQPLRTGSVTATSFVPLRSVPFRVVCMVGLDDGTLPSGDSEGDDLVATEPLMGDSDPRLDLRRVVLDAALAASDRFIVTCVGKSIKNNSPVPLVTPLAEFVDFCGRLGVDVPDDPDKVSGIEVLHPRHMSSTRNFVKDSEAVVPGFVWCHDTAARAASIQMSQKKSRVVASVLQFVEPIEAVSLKDLEDLVIDPLNYYLTRTLKIFKDYGEKKRAWESTLPTSADDFDIADAAAALDALLDVEPEDVALPKWRNALSASDILPVTPFVKEALDDAEAVALGIRAARQSELKGVSCAEEVSLTFESGVTLHGVIDGIFDEPSVLSIVHYYEQWKKDQTRMAIRLLVLCAAGSPIRHGVLVHRGGGKSRSTKRYLALDLEITQQSALKSLEALLAVEPIARTIPCPLFGKTAEKLYRDNLDDDAVLEAFVTHAENKVYRQSNECKVFGDDPLFDDVYTVRKEHLEWFFSAYYGFMSFEAVPKRKSSWTIKQ